MNPSRRRALAAILAATAVAGPFPAFGQRADATDSSIKAAYLYRFAGYIEWPPGAFPTPDAPFVIGVTGSEEVAADLFALVTGRRINGRPVEVRRVREGEPLRGLHLLFVGRESAARLPVIARTAQAQGILVVGESESALELGTAINFVPVDNRIGFDVSLEAAERAGLRISSRMLAVARRVVPKGPS